MSDDTYYHAFLNRDRVIHIVDGGVPAWGRAGYPIQR